MTLKRSPRRSDTENRVAPEVTAARQGDGLAVRRQVENDSYEQQVLELLDRLSETVKSRSVKGALATSYTPFCLPASSLSPKSLAASLFGHLAVITLLVLISAPKKETPIIDLAKHTIIYYHLSESFPNISPLPSMKETTQRRGAARKPLQTPSVKREQLIAINTQQESPDLQLLEQPELKLVRSLPKLSLPNILMNEPDVRPAERPPSESSKLLKGLKQLLDANHDPLPASDPRTLETTTSLSMIDLAETGQQLKPQWEAALEEKRLAELRLSEPAKISLPPAAISNRAILGPDSKPAVVEPPPFVEKPKMLVTAPIAEQAIKLDAHHQLSAPSQPRLLLYSMNPSLPQQPELVVPKAHLPTTLNASPDGGEGKGPATGTPIVEEAGVLRRNVSVKNLAPLQRVAAGPAIAQAPLPPPEILPQKPPLAPPLRPKTLKIPELKSLSSRRLVALPSSTSPLDDVARQGRHVYTISISSPNFTSKKGSWVFRFAELAKTDDLSLVSSSSDVARHVPEGVSLSAPSPTVKVDPRYPPEIMRERIEGLVVMFAIIRKDGTIDSESVRILRKLDPRLDTNARQALLAWKFRPSLRNGRPVDVQAEITVPFYFREDDLAPR